MSRHLPLERLLVAYASQPIKSIARRERVEIAAKEIVAAIKRGGEFDPARDVVSTELAASLRSQLMSEQMDTERANGILNVLSEAWWWGACEAVAPLLQLFARVPRVGSKRMRETRRDLDEPSMATVSAPMVSRRPKREVLRVSPKVYRVPSLVLPGPLSTEDPAEPPPSVAPTHSIEPTCTLAPEAVETVAPAASIETATSSGLKGWLGSLFRKRGAK